MPAPSALGRVVGSWFSAGNGEVGVVEVDVPAEDAPDLGQQALVGDHVEERAVKMHEAQLVDALGNGLVGAAAFQDAAFVKVVDGLNQGLAQVLGNSVFDDQEAVALERFALVVGQGVLETTGIHVRPRSVRVRRFSIEIAGAGGHLAGLPPPLARAARVARLGDGDDPFTLGAFDVHCVAASRGDLGGGPALTTERRDDADRRDGFDVGIVQGLKGCAEGFDGPRRRLACTMTRPSRRPKASV